MKHQTFLRMTPVQRRTERWKAEITELVLEGVIPATVADLSEIHDFIDGNCLGGFCDEPLDDELQALADDKSDPLDEPGLMSQALQRYSGEVMDAVNIWIEDGGIPARLAALQQSHNEEGHLEDAHRTFYTNRRPFARRGSA